SPMKCSARPKNAGNGAAEPASRLSLAPPSFPNRVTQRRKVYGARRGAEAQRDDAPIVIPDSIRDRGPQAPHGQISRGGAEARSFWKLMRRRRFENPCRYAASSLSAPPRLRASA